jgi:hypothetical protein
VITEALIAILMEVRRLELIFAKLAEDLDYQLDVAEALRRMEAGQVMPLDDVLQSLSNS